MYLALGIASIAAVGVLLMVIGRRREPVHQTRQTTVRVRENGTFGYGDAPFEGKLDWKPDNGPRIVAPLWKAEHNRLVREG